MCPDQIQNNFRMIDKGRDRSESFIWDLKRTSIFSYIYYLFSLYLLLAENPSPIGVACDITPLGGGNGKGINKLVLLSRHIVNKIK